MKKVYELAEDIVIAELSCSADEVQKKSQDLASLGFCAISRTQEVGKSSVSICAVACTENTQRTIEEAGKLLFS